MMAKSQIIVVSLITMVLTATGCGSGVSGDKPFELIVLKGPSGMALAWMLDSAYQAGNNDFEILTMDEPMQLRPLLLKEAPEMAMVPLNMASILYNSGIGYQVAGIPVWGSLYLCSTDSTIADLSDLNGKTIHVMARGLNPDLLFRYLLSQNNLNPEKDVVLDYSFPSHLDLANAMASGLGEVAVLSEPMLSMAMDKNPRLRPVIDLNEVWMRSSATMGQLPQTALLVKTAFALGHPDLLQRMIGDIAKSIEKVNADHIKAARMMVSAQLLPNERIAIEAMQRCSFRFLSGPEAREPIYHYLRVLHNFNPNATGGKIPDEGFIYHP